MEQPSSKYKLTPTRVRVGLWEGGERSAGRRDNFQTEGSPGWILQRFSGGVPEVFRRCSGGADGVPFLMAIALVRDDFGPRENDCTPFSVI